MWARARSTVGRAGRIIEDRQDKQLRDRAFNQLLLNGLRDEPGADGRIPRRDRALPARLHLRLCEQRRASGLARTQPLAQAIAAPPEGDLYDRRTALSASTRIDRIRVRLRRWRTNSAVATSVSRRTRRRPGRCCCSASTSCSNRSIARQSGRNRGSGRAVLTALCSEAQPFIRYRTGDMVQLGDEVCSEGRGLHVIGEVAGRMTTSWSGPTAP